MTAERYERLRLLFDKAAEFPAEERERRASELCQGDDADVLDELLALLRLAGTQADGFDTPQARFDTPGGLPAFLPNEILLGRFRIVRFLGRGGMGEVYEADDSETGCVALKTIRPEIAENPQVLARFRQEVQCARKATGTNVCRIYELFSVAASNGRPAIVFLTMEFLEGVTLSERIEKGAPLTSKEAEVIAIQICAGLQTIHAADVIHRDLKSRNIMLAERKRGMEAVVMDFGLAREVRAASAAAGASTSASAAVVGTPQYMAPEQFHGGAMTPATDVYALGVVLYELATGKLPFQGGTPLAAAVERAKTITPASSVRRGFPRRWDSVIERCLRYEPGERYQSALEVAAALTERTSWAVPAKRYVARHRGWTTVAAALILLAAAGIFFWYHARVTSVGGSLAAMRWYEQGTAALREGTYLKATNALQMAVEQDKTFVLAHARLADCWNELDFESKAKDEMLEASSHLERGGLSKWDEEYVEAVRHTLVRDFAAALADYQKIFDSLPEARKAEGYVDLGRAYEKAGNSDKALESYKAAAELDSQAPAAFVRLGILESRRKESAAADAAFTRAEQLYRAASNLEGLAEIAYQRGNDANTQLHLEEARRYLNDSLQAAKAIPSMQLEIRALTRLSVSEYLDHHSEKSVELANEAISLAQERGLDYWAIDGLIRLGNAYLSSSNSKQAGEYFGRALKLAEASSRPRLIALARFGLASVRLSENRPAEALVLAKSSLDYYRADGFKSETSQALTLTLRAQRNNGDNLAALATGQELLKLSGGLSQAAKMGAEESVGSVLLDLERYPEALAHFEHALDMSRELHRQLEYHLLHYAQAAWRLGNYDDARRALSEIPNETRAGHDIAQGLEETSAEMLLSQRRYAEAKQVALKSLADRAIDDKEFFFLVLGKVETLSGSVERAKDWCQRALDEAQRETDNPSIAAANLALADAYLARGSAASARPFAQEAHDFFVKAGMRESELFSLVTLARISEKMGDGSGSEHYAKLGMDILSDLEHNWIPQQYKSYLSRPDVYEIRGELLRLGSI